MLACAEQDLKDKTKVRFRLVLVRFSVGIRVDVKAITALTTADNID
jgi:hypothetical protein